MVVVGYYTVSGVVGRGRYGWVSRAKHQVVGHLVALKHAPWAVGGRCEGGANHVHCDHVGESAWKAALEREVEVLAKISHPSVVALLEVVHGPSGGLVVCLEDLGNTTLRALVQDHGRPGLAESTVAVVFAQIARGLAYMHSVGLIHRDVKPDNIMVVGSQCKFPVAKLIDLGLAVSLVPGVPLSTSKNRAGTLSFMAPELMMANKNYGGEVDVFSLGASLYFSITGETPFREYNFGSTRSTTSVFGLQAHHLDAIDSMPPDVRCLLIAALAVDPKNRWNMDVICSFSWLKNASGCIGVANAPSLQRHPRFVADIHKKNKQLMAEVSKERNTVCPKTDCFIRGKVEDNIGIKTNNSRVSDRAVSPDCGASMREMLWNHELVFKVSVLLNKNEEEILDQLEDNPWGPVAGIYHLLLLKSRNI